MRVAIGNALAVLGLGAALITAQGAQAQVVEREIRIGPETKWVNVTHMETVRFVNDRGQSFTYRFDDSPALTVELNKVAPEGVLGNQRITAYIQPCGSMLGGG